MIHLENVLKISLQDVFKTSWWRLEDALKTFFHDVLKTSWKYLGDVLKTNILVLTKTKTSSKEVRLSEHIRLDQDFLKTSSEDGDKRRLQDVFKTSSSGRIFTGKYSGNAVCRAYFLKNDSKPFWIYCSSNSGQSFLLFRPGRTIVYFVVIFNLRSGEYYMKNIPIRVFSGL